MRFPDYKYFYSTKVSTNKRTNKQTSGPPKNSGSPVQLSKFARYNEVSLYRDSFSYIFTVTVGEKKIVFPPGGGGGGRGNPYKRPIRGGFTRKGYLIRLQVYERDFTS